MGMAILLVLLGMSALVTISYFSKIWELKGNTMNDEELKQIHGMFTDLWRFFKKYCEVKPDDSYWQQLAEESKTINAKYSSPLCQRLLLDIIVEFECVGKKKNALD